MSVQPAPREWDPAWEGTHKERLRYQNDIDFLELSKAKDPTQFAASFICVQPLPIQFKNLNMNNNKHKFAIIGCSPTCARINFYADPILGFERMSTYDPKEYLKHIYINMMSKTPDKPRELAKATYEEYKDNPYGAIILVFQYKGSKKEIPMDKLITPALITSLTNALRGSGQGTLKEMISAKREEFAQNSKKVEEEPEPEEKEKKEKKKTPAKEKKKRAKDSDEEEEEEPPKKKKEKTPAKEKKNTPKKKKKSDEESKAINVSKMDPEKSKELFDVFVGGFSRITGIPEERFPILAQVVMETIDALKDTKK